MEIFGGFSAPQVRQAFQPIFPRSVAFCSILWPVEWLRNPPGRLHSGPVLATLSSLRIKNLALVEELDWQLAPRLRRRHRRNRRGQVRHHRRAQAPARRARREKPHPHRGRLLHGGGVLRSAGLRQSWTRNWTDTAWRAATTGNLIIKRRSPSPGATGSSSTARRPPSPCSSSWVTCWWTSTARTTTSRS